MGAKEGLCNNRFGEKYRILTPQPNIDILVCDTKTVMAFHLTCGVVI